ncbi:ABC-2 type transport system ATP-binding protein [Lachnospiraceae bacterium KH1T2]|nr:ABC-2 type transport system ATP-binding protein [Lachnospiraceae bacterium KH1T2]
MCRLLDMIKNDTSILIIGDDDTIKKTSTYIEIWRDVEIELVDLYLFNNECNEIDYDMYDLVVISPSVKIKNIINKKFYRLSEDDLFEIKNKATQLRIRSKLRFEVHIVEHCNLNCCGCNHFSPLAKEKYLNLDDYIKDIERLSYLFQGEMEYIELLGGEPLLHPNIECFMIETRKKFPIGQIVLVTNGVLLSKMKNHFWDVLRKNDIILSPTRYPIPVDYDYIRKLAEERGVKYEEFDMKTDLAGNKILENFHIDVCGNNDKEEMFRKCNRGNECVFLCNGKIFSCVTGANIKHLKEYFNIDSINNLEEDGIDIYKVKSGEEILLHILKPMNACAYCNIHEKKDYIKFRQSKRMIDEWI